MAKIKFNEDMCKGCSLCVGVCPRNLVSIATDRLNAKGFNPAQVVDKESCIGCGMCALMCPDVVITIVEEGENK
jgi:hypothetical protein